MQFDQRAAEEIVEQVTEQTFRIALLETLLTEHVPDWENLYEEKVQTGASEAWLAAQKATKTMRDRLLQPPGV